MDEGGALVRLRNYPLCGLGYGMIRGKLKLRLWLVFELSAFSYL